MKHKRVLLGWLTVAVVLLAAGCASASTPAAASAAAEKEQETLPPVTTAKGEVIAEGSVEPERWSELAFRTSGEVVEIAAQEGSAVAADVPILRLDTDELEIALQSAQQDVVAARAALDLLLAGATEAQIARAVKDNADQIVQAEVALQAAKLQLEKAHVENPVAGVDAAQARVKQLNRQLDQIRAQDPTSGVSVAEVVVERAQIALGDAEDEYKQALDRPWEDHEIRDAWAEQVVQKKLDVRQAQAQLNGAHAARTAHARSLAVVASQIKEAEVQIEQALTAQDAYDVALEILAADVNAAQLRLEALRTWDNPLLDPANEQQIAQAEARLKQAELAVSRLNLQIEQATLRASFAGTIVEIYVEHGDPVSVGQPAVVLATLDQLVVRTTDLTELDIAQVVIGQPAAVSVDALRNEAWAEQEFAGTVSEIALRSGTYQGDVVYPITVELSDVSQLPLRWGMTAMVKIDTK